MEGIVALIIVTVIVILLGYGIARAKKPPVATDKGTPPIAYSGKSYPFSEVTNDANFPHVRSIHTKIRGVTKKNPDGANRQQIIRRWCHSGDALFLVREPNNLVDPNAILVRRIVYADDQDKKRLGEQLGYVSRELAEDLAPKMDRDGFVLMAWIMNVSGSEDEETLGVNIQIEEYRPAKRVTARKH